jgi:hypothetical protein
MKKILFIPIILAFACDRPECTNTNPIFDQNEPASNAYKKELVHQIEAIGKSEISYYIAGFEERNNSNYLVLNVQGGDLCAIGYFEIRDPLKLEVLIKTKAVGYRGAEIKGFEFTIENEENIELVYSSLDRIID